MFMYCSFVCTHHDLVFIDKDITMVSKNQKNKKSNKAFYEQIKKTKNKQIVKNKRKKKSNINFFEKTHSHKKSKTLKNK